MASDVDIVIEVATQGVDRIANLSTALQQLNRTVMGATNPMKALDARSRALNQALGYSGRSAKEHAKSVSDLYKNHLVLSNELKRVNTDLKNIAAGHLRASGASAQFSRAAVRDLQNYQKALKSVKARALVEDLRSMSLEMRRLGKDAQFTGRSMIIGLTTPIIGFARFGLQALVTADKEVVRLTKVLETVAPSAELAAKKLGVDLANATAEQASKVDELVNNYNSLNKSLISISTRFGISRSITVGLAADFAELGLQSRENIANITELTAATERLGNMDIGNARELVQSLYFQAIRAMQQSGEARQLTPIQRETKAIQAATAQLYLFNSVENVTALTLRDLGDAFPEVAAAATSFGLSMTEAAAMLAPMKAAGFEIGASANSIKVSLQRITAPTKQNAEMFKSLSKQYGLNFELIKGTGLDAIQALIDAYNTLNKSAAGQEGVMEFFAKVFGVRQGPRMETAIAQLADFDAILKDAKANTELAEKQIQSLANTTIKSANESTGANIPLIDSYKSIGIIARIATARAGQEVEGFSKKVTISQINAAKQVRKEVGKQIFAASQQGDDLIGKITTEAGRAMFIQLAGAQNAQQVATRELEQSLSSLEVKIQVIKNNFKMFASEIISNLRPALEKISDITTKLYEAFTNLDPRTKKFLTNLIIGLSGLAASIGPLIFVFGQFRLAIGSIGAAVFSFLPRLKYLSVESVAASKGLLRLTKPLELMGHTVQNTNGKFATFIATLASGNGPVARMAEKLGLLTGVMQQQQTAGFALTRAVEKQAPLGSVSVDGLPGFEGDKAGKKGRLNLPGRLSAKQIFQQTMPGGALGSADELFDLARNLESEGYSVDASGRVRKQGKFAAAPKFKGKKLSSGTMQSLMSNLQQSRAVSVTGGSAGIPIAQQISREKAFARRGVTFESATGRQGPGIADRFLFKGREITEERAQKIAGGGLGGRLARAREFGQRFKGGVGDLTIAKPKAFAQMLNPLSAYKKGIEGAKLALNVFNADNAKMGLQSAGLFKKLSLFVKGFANSFALVKKAIMLTRVALIGSGIGVALLAVAAIVVMIAKNFDEFKAKAKPAMDSLKDAFEAIKKAGMALIRPFMDFFATFSDGGKEGATGVGVIAQAFNGLAEVVEFIAKIIEKVFIFIGKIIRKYLGYVAGVVRGIINIVSGIIDIFKGNFLEGFKKIGLGVAKVFYNMLGPFKIFISFVLTGLEKLFGILGRFIPGLKKASDGIKAFKKELEGSSKLNIAGDKKKPVIDPATSGEITEQIGNATGEGFEQGAESGKEKLKKALREVGKEVMSAVFENLKGAMDKAVTNLTDALKKQKEDSLKVFDTQLETIDKLKKAEESLTATREYEQRKREIQDERALNRENYIRNRRLAIYEGRVDDARMLDLEERKSKLESQNQLSQVEDSRRKQLADENFQFLKDSISEAKKQASDYFDEAIKAFEENAKKITQFPPRTAEEFQTQLGQLEKLAKDTATNNGTEFSSMVNKMASSIVTDLPNKTVGFFSTNLGLLVAEAKNKYGLGVTAGDNTSIIGSTLLMLDQMQQKFTGDTAVGSTWSELTSGLSTTLLTVGNDMNSTIMPNIMTGIENVINTNNPFGKDGIFATAVKDALTEIKYKYETETLAMATSLDALKKKFPELKSLIDDLKKAYKEYSAAVDAAEKSSTAGGGSGGKTVGSGYIMPSVGLVNKGLMNAEFKGTVPVSTIKVPRKQFGGYIPKAPTTPVPALLHGGEFIVNAKAVQNLGIATLNNINSLRFATPKTTQPPQMTSVNSTQNINLYVDNFIGEKAWFESMMKDYNLKVVPANQKSAGLEQRTISTYTGLNRGM